MIAAELQHDRVHLLSLPAVEEAQPQRVADQVDLVGGERLVPLVAHLLGVPRLAGADQLGEVALQFAVAGVGSEVCHADHPVTVAWFGTRSGSGDPVSSVASSSRSSQCQ